MPKSILVVDDEPKIVALNRSYLEASGFKVAQAFDGKSALTTVRELAPDCVILDISMPGMDGLSVAWSTAASAAKSVASGDLSTPV